MLPQHIFVERPESRVDEPLSTEDAKRIDSALTNHHHELAAVVLEPVVQGAGGMWFYSPEYLARVAELCAELDVLLIADEIATGFGRTGRLFACEHANVEPDIMCLGKALTGGYMSLAATLTNTRVARGISADGGVLMHGPTFMANPLACAVARKSIDLLQAGPWRSRIGDIEGQLQRELRAFREHAAVRDVRVFGAIGVVQTHEPVPVADLQRVFVEREVWIRPFADLIYLMPPYIMGADDLACLTSAIGAGLDTL